jgi:hypothetical protein
MEQALQRLHRLNEVNLVKAKLRPWLQDFSLGAVYDEAMVRAQIAATIDALGEEYTGFALWSSNNLYTEEVLLSH